MLALAVPLALGTAPAKDQHLSLPTVAGVRAAADRLIAFVAGSHVATPKGPQQESGTAAGKPHEVPASATRATGRAAGRAPGKGPGQMPPYAVHAPKARPYTTGPANPGSAASFSLKTSKLVPSGATATSSLYRNADGSYTRLEYTRPVNYQTASKAWAPIDTDLVTGPSGRWRQQAGPLSVSFAPNADSRLLASVSGSAGTTGSFGLKMALTGAARTYGTVAGPAVTYSGALTDTTVTQQATATGIAEALTVSAAGAPAEWAFPLGLTGLTPSVAADGTVRLVTATGKGALVIRPTAGLNITIISGPNGTELHAAINRDWLGAPGRAFPVTVGFEVSTDLRAAGSPGPPGTLNFAGPSGASVRGTHVTAASLHLPAACSARATVSVRQAGGPALGSWTGQCAGGTGWVSVPFTRAGLKALGSAPGARLSVAATGATVQAAPAAHGAGAGAPAAAPGATAPPAVTASPSATASPEAAAGPYLALTVTANIAPQVDATYPPDNYNSPDLTPELMATGEDADSGPSALQYDFQVYSSTGTLLADSGLISTADWTVPSGKLAWGQTYYWVVQDFDGAAYSAAPDPSYLATPVPQPLVTSGLSQNESGPGFNASSGNYTTSATDLKVAVVGPALSIERDYNSADPRVTGAIGAGWSSVLDMAVSPGQASSAGTTATEVVTYPDGQQVAFGLNANGTYTPPQGRFSTFAPVTGGGFTLTDKNDTKYTFTQSLGGGKWGITSLTDALGHALNFTYSGNHVTTITSAATGRHISLSWTTPTGATGSHVDHLWSDPTAGTNTNLTVKYNYSGDQLTSVCLLSDGAQPCTSYSYQAGSGYRTAVLDSGAHSYWRLDETSGTTAASSVIVNEGTDNATYSNVALNQDAGPLTGAKAAAFNGTSSKVTLPTNLVSGATYQSVSMWFKEPATASDGVLFSYQLDPLSKGTTLAHYTPSLYIGSDGILHGEFWTNTVQPLVSSAPVNDNNWHLVTLTAAGNTQSLYLDGALQQTLANKAIEINPQLNDYVGAGFLGGAWPDEANHERSGDTGYATYFKGDISDFGFWPRPLTANEIAAMYAAGKNQASLLTTTTRPTATVYQSVTYNAADSTVHSTTDDNGGNWTLAAPTVTGSSQVYVGAVLGTQPKDYWRLADTGTANAVNQVKGGTAVYNTVELGHSGSPFADTTTDRFGGSAYIVLPGGSAGGLSGAGNQTVSLWFKTGTAGGVLLSTSADPITAGTTPGSYTPILYIGSDGYLHGKFWDGSTAVVMHSAAAVDDSQWHQVILTAGGGSQDMLVDGVFAASESSTVTGEAPAGQSNMYVGTGFVGGGWPNEPHQSSSSTTGYASYFQGYVSEVSFTGAKFSQQQVDALHVAAQSSSGLTPVETDQVTDPGGHTLTYKNDPRNGDRMLSQTNGLGQTTSYGYDVTGFQDRVVDPSGDVTDTGYDVRGNMVSRTTCQDQVSQKCSTSYYSYYPDDTTATLTPDPRNDLQLTSRDGRSSSAADNTYLTTSTFNSLGLLLSQTTPPVPGFPSGRTATYAYTDGTTTAGGYNGAIPPAGLEYQVTTPGGAVTTTLYDGQGDVAEVIDPDGQATTYTYDGIGRELSHTVISDSYPAGLTTTYVYNAESQVTRETSPPVQDRVSGATHTAQTTTTYSHDGDVLSQTVADTSGGDASRTVSFTYDSHDLQATATDAAGNVTRTTYNSYGDLASQTDPAGNETDYTYDPDGRLLTTTLANYAGGLAGPNGTTLPAGPLVQESRAYDPAGRLASVTDAMGFVTSYGYTDDGLVSTITRSDPTSGASFTEESTAYDAAGNVVSKVTNDGFTTTQDVVDAAGRVTTETVDPANLNRVTSYTYTPDDNVATKAIAQGTGSPLQSASYTYDHAGNLTSQSLALPGAGGPAGWWKLDETSGTTAADSSGRGNQATATGVTWSGGAATFAGAGPQGITTSGPVVDTTGSFTVAAWANLAGNLTANQTVASQDAGTDSGFYLKYYPNNGDWEFMRPRSDTTSPVNTTINSAAPAATGTWTFLTGTYDSSTGTMTLYVNGAASGSPAGDSTPIASTGSLAIGRSKWNGNSGDWFDGSVSGVQVYPRALTAAQVLALYQLGRNGGTSASGQQVTSWTLDQRGLPASETDPNGNITRYGYDEAGRLAVTSQPPAWAETADGTRVWQRPTVTTGYDTFGDAVASEDPSGNVTTDAYDAEGRQTSETLPSYTQPGTGTTFSPASTQHYNALGQVDQALDARGNLTTSSYDQLGDLTSQTLPDGGVISYVYDANGDQRSVTDPAGARTEATYDFMGRQLTATQDERAPATAYTTTSTYGTGGFLWRTVAPDGETIRRGYNHAGELISVLDAAGNTTGYSYDALGRQTATTHPDGTKQQTTYDAAGNVVGLASLDSNGTTVLTSQSATFDGDGNMLSSINGQGFTTKFGYDSGGRVTSEVQPVSATSAITTSFGYDADGNQTRYTDGLGNNWLTTYNTLGLPESRIEPATSQYSSAADSTFTTAYDQAGHPVSQVQPGGVTVTSAYNNMGELTDQSGSGASGATPSRHFDYNLAGNVTATTTTNTAPSGQASNATSESFSYNDRGLLTSASGTAGSTSISYDGDGQPASVADAAGTTSYGYDSAGRVASMSDPVSGTSLSYAYDTMSRVQKVTYGAVGSGDVRTLGYDKLGEVTSDTLATAGGTTVASQSYGYDKDGELTSASATGLAAAASSTYTYDQAGRLTSWNNGTTTTSYGYDAAGNLTQDGARTLTYDARGQLTSDGASAYAYTANGTLASATSSTAMVISAFDAYGDQVSSGQQSYGYDALGRVTSDAATGGGPSWAFSYSGDSSRLASDGASAYSWDTSGQLVGSGAAGAAGTGSLALVNVHGDVVGGFTGSAGALSGSRAYDPWGTVTASLGTVAGQLGFESGWTDAATGKVSMGARWYSPATGGFTSRDSQVNNPVPDPAAASPFGYAGDDPLDNVDPSGHMRIHDAQYEPPAVEAYWTLVNNPPKPPPPASCPWYNPSCLWHRVTSAVSRTYHSAVSRARAAMVAAERAARTLAARAAAVAKKAAKAVVHVARNVAHVVRDAAVYGARAAVAVWHDVGTATSRAYRKVTAYAKKVIRRTVHVVKTAYHAAKRAATATARFARAHAAVVR